MRIPSGVTDQYIYFVAVDSTDYVTRKTGLSSFTVYRARNGAAAVAYTTPTIAEVSSANMPGVYSLLLDEDMTIDSGDASQEVCLHITQASMAPVTRVFELYRVPVSAGETLTVSSGVGSANVTQFGGAAGTFSGGRPEVNTTHAAGTAWASGAITAGSIASNAITSAKIATDAIGAAQIAANAIGASELASDAVTEIQTGLALGTDLATVAGYIDTEVAAIKAKTDQLAFSTANRVDAQVFGIEANAITATSIASAAITASKIATDAITSAKIAADAIGASELATDAVNEIADALLDRVDAVETGMTFRQALRFMASLLGGKVSGAGTGTEVFRNAVADSKARVTVTVDSLGNRSAISNDLT